MVYCETIENSKTWTCPKSGVWKVICVGGGGGGYAYGPNGATEYEATGGSGGTTSFGSYLSAAGGSAGSSSNAFITTDLMQINGANGYNGASTYGAEGNGFTGVGYGASGGSICKGTTSSMGTVAPGYVGDVKTAILDIDANIAIACTIGTAGGAAGSNTAKYIKAYAGRKGAIIVQYLGESM